MSQASFAYLSPRGTIEFVNYLASLPGNNPPPVFPLPDFPETLPIGGAATVSHNEIQATLVIPPDVVQGIGSYIVKLQTKAMKDQSTDKTKVKPTKKAKVNKGKRARNQ